MPHLPVFIVFGLALEHPRLDDAMLELSEVDLLMAHRISLEFSAPEPFLHVIKKMLMQPFDVHRVEGVLHDLQPIAGDHRRADIAQHAVAHEQFPARQQRRGLWAEVSENQPAKFFYRICRHVDAIFKRAVGVFGLLIGLLETFSVSVIQPAMVRTAQAVFFGNAQNQRHAPVRALRADQPGPPLFVAIEHQVFAEHSDRLRRFLD